MAFKVSYGNTWEEQAISYEIGYSSLFECERIFIKLKKTSPRFKSDLLRLYDFSAETRDQMIQDIETKGHLKLEKYYDRDETGGY